MQKKSLKISILQELLQISYHYFDLPETQSTKSLRNQWPSLQKSFQLTPFTPAFCWSALKFASSDLQGDQAIQLSAVVEPHVAHVFFYIIPLVHSEETET